ncbi:hypothetical protein ACWCQZ_44400 [Streptomyces sp. NPDC002285]
MALRRCRECTTTFAVGLPACPHCASTDHEEDGAMPKITRHGGPTIAGASVVAGGWSDEGDPDVWPKMRESAGTGEPMQAVEGYVLEGDGSGRALPPVDEEGGEESSPGNSSSTSDEKPSTEPDKKPSSRRKPARTTASRSRKGQTASSSASSTDGAPADGTSAADDEAAE